MQKYLDTVAYVHKSEASKQSIFKKYYSSCAIMSFDSWYAISFLYLDWKY